MARAAASTSLNVDSVFAASAGLTSTAMRAAPGTSSRRSSRRFERIELRHAIDEVLRLAVEEQVGGRRSGSNGVDRDRAAAQLLRQDRRQGLYRRLRRCVDAIGFEPQADDAGREVHDAA